MPLAHQRLVDLLHSLFASAAAPSLSGATIYRQRTRPVSTEVMKAVSLRVVRSKAQQITIQPLNWTTLIAVEYAARAATGEAPDEAVGPLIAAGHELLMADTSLPSAGFELMPDATLAWDEDALQERIGVCTAIYEVRHRTGYASIAV